MSQRIAQAEACDRYHEHSLTFIKVKFWRCSNIGKEILQIVKDTTMTQPTAVLGDRTSHGGTLITGSMYSFTAGQAWARVDEMDTCPRSNETFPRRPGYLSPFDDEKAVEYDGCKLACGALLTVRQQMNLTNPTAFEQPGTSLPLAIAFSSGCADIGAGVLAKYEDQPADVVARCRCRFRVVEAGTGEALTGRAVRLRSGDGQYVSGNFDTDGVAEWIARETNEALAFDLVQDVAA